MNIRSISIAAFILGILFKFLHWPYANIVVVTGAVLTIVTLTILLARKPGPWTLTVQRPAVLFGSITVSLVGVLIKMMHWPGANLLMLLGMMTCAAWFLLTPPRRIA